MKKYLLIVFLMVHYCGLAQLTYIPDANFESYIETHNIYGFAVAVGDSESMGNGILGDHLVSTSKISMAVDLGPGPNITDLTGINAFTSLEYLYLYNNNQISNLSISLNSFGVLGITNNGLTTLDLSGCPNLWALVASNNELTNVDLSANTALQEIYLNNNLLEGTVDLSANGGITYLEIRNNPVERIDLRNRNASNLPFEFNATQNPDLDCIFVDDPNTIPSGWTIDNTASYVADEDACNNLSIADVEQNVAYIYPNPSQGNFNVVTDLPVNTIELLDLSGKVVAQYKTQKQISTRDLDKGLYVLRIYTDNGVIFKKIIFE